MRKTYLRITLIGSLLLVCSGSLWCSTPWTPVLPTQNVRAIINLPSKFSSLNIQSGVHDVFLPKGWSAEVFYAGAALGKPRFLAWGPDSVLFVANMGKNTILALPDMDKDGVADTALIATSAPGNTSSITFYRDTMYLGSESGISKYWRTSGMGYVYDASQRVVDKRQVSSQLGGNHVTRTVVVDSVHNKLYLSIGSKGNADRETERALIEEFDFDGNNKRVYATGVRNAVGLVLHPRTGQLWSNNNGSDQQGNNVPPEWIDQVREGGFYGHPLAYHVGNWFDFNRNGYGDLLPITSNDSMLVNSMVPPAALVEAHCAPMQMVFSTNTMLPEYQNGLFMAMRGSWNRQPVSGSKIVYLQFDSDQDTIANYVVDFCTGFLPDSNNSASRWARPVGIALSSDGSVFMSSDDVKQFILRLKPPQETDVPSSSMLNTTIQLSPNPTSSYLTVYTHSENAKVVSVISMLGEKLIVMRTNNQQVTIDTTTLPAGSYIATVTSENSSGSKFFNVVH